MSRRGRRRGGGEGHADAALEDEVRFLVSYSDLLMVLMALFLVMWVISQVDLKKFEEFKGGLGDFGNPAAEGQPPTDPGAPVVAPTPEGEGDSGGQGGNLNSEQLRGIADDIETALENAGLPSVEGGIRVDERGLVVSIRTDDVLFESGSAVLTGQGHHIIAALGPELAAIANPVIVEGHTDRVPFVGRPGYNNWDLSVDRAVAVVKVFQDELGVNPARLSAAGYGEHHPIDPGQGPAADAKNRRVEILILASPGG